jgi:hypothetical protein
LKKFFWREFLEKCFLVFSSKNNIIYGANFIGIKEIPEETKEVSKKIQANWKENVREK